MDNFQAILKMDRKQMERFLDGVYCTGLNDGIYATQLPEQESTELLDKNPFDEQWLSQKAEDALLESAEKKEFLLDDLATSILRTAGIELTEESSNNMVVF